MIAVIFLKWRFLLILIRPLPFNGSRQLHHEIKLDLWLLWFNFRGSFDCTGVSQFKLISAHWNGCFRERDSKTFREIIFVLFSPKLDGDEVLSEQQRDEINSIALSWDLPSVNASNRRWLFQQIMQHTVRLLLIVNPLYYTVFVLTMMKHTE